MSHPGTPLRAVRIPEWLWAAAQSAAAANGETVSDVVRRALVEYGDGPSTPE